MDIYYWGGKRGGKNWRLKIYPPNVAIFGKNLAVFGFWDLVTLKQSFERFAFVLPVLSEKWLRLSNLKIWTRLFRKFGLISCAKYAKMVQDLERLFGIAVWSSIKYVSSAMERTRSVLVVNWFPKNIARLSKICWILKAWNYKSHAKIRRMDAMTPSAKTLWKITNVDVFTMPVHCVPTM